MPEQIRREFTFPFPIEKIKTAIEDTCRTGVGGAQVQNRNSAFNSYNSALVKNLYSWKATATGG
jgi:hypothetical protein